MKVNLLNIEKNGFLALLLNIEREFQRNYIAFDAKNVETAQQKISEYLHPSQEKI